MNAERRSFFRVIMQTAWALYRADLRGPTPRTFAEALGGAWRWMKAQAARIAAAPQWAKSPRSAPVAFRSMLHSPTRRGLTGKAYAYTLSGQAGRITSRIGA